MPVKYLVFGLFFTGLSAGCPGGEIDTNKSNNRIQVALDALHRQQIEEAEREANLALGYNPKNEVAHNVLGVASMLRASRAGQAAEFDDCLTGIDAEVHQKERDAALAAADPHFARAIEYAPDYGEAYANRGLVALQLEDYDRARGFFTKALEKPNRLGVGGRLIGTTRAHLGWVHFQLGDLPAAAGELRKAIQFDGQLCIALYRLGRVYFARQEWNKGLEAFTKVTALPNCQLQEAYLYLSKTQAALGHSAEAAATVQRCIDLKRESCLASECSRVGDQTANPPANPSGANL